jgi:hypothetical protein
MSLAIGLFVGYKETPSSNAQHSTSMQPVKIVESSTIAAKVRWTVDEILWVTMSTPLPSIQVSQPLFPDTDGARIGQLLQWIDQAMPDTKSQFTEPKRSNVLHISLKTGESIHISPAWACTQKTELNGNRSTNCTTVKDEVAINLSEANQRNDLYFAHSPELFDFLTEKHMEWMPERSLLNYPESIELGKPFTVSGNGWVGERVMLEIQNNRNFIWSKEIATDHGTFSSHNIMLETKDVSGKDIMLYIRSASGGSIGVSLSIKSGKTTSNAKAFIGKSVSCVKPPKDLKRSGQSYELKTEKTTEEPGMKYGYVKM